MKFQAYHGLPASQPASQPNINLSLQLGYLTQNMLARLNVIYIWQRRPLALNTNKLTFIQTSERIPANNARSSLCVSVRCFFGDRYIVLDFDIS